MKKWILCVICILPLSTWAETAFEQSELVAIEHEILALKVRLHRDRLKELKEEVKGQGLMIADWEAYAHELELIREQKKEDNQLELQIKKLEERKAQLHKKQLKTE